MESGKIAKSMAGTQTDKAPHLSNTAGAVQALASRTLKEVWQKNYETGKYSDLIVRTSDRDLNVHKSVVCELCPFFEAAIRGDWEEARTGVIEVTESAATMDIVFRHLYTVRLPFLPQAKDDEAVLRSKACFDNFFLALEVLETADKYLLPELGHAADLVLLNFVRFSDTEALVEVAPILEQKHQTQASNIFALTIIELSRKFEDLLREETAWYALHAHADLQKMVIDFRMGNYSEESVAKFFEARTFRPAADFQTPSKRSIWYLQKWGRSFLSM